MRSFLRRLFSRKTLVRLAFVIAAIITLLVALILEENWRGERAWAAYSESARRAGMKLTIAEHLGPAVPDDENFGAIPLIQEIFRAQAEGRPPPEPFALTPPPEPEPDSAAPPVRESVELVRWRDHFVAIKFLDAAGSEPARDVLRALERFEPPLQQLRGGANLPHSRMPVRWEDGFSAMLPHLPLFQGASRILALRLRAHAALGEMEAAYRDFQDGLRLFRSLEREPVVICGLVRLSMLLKFEAALQASLADGQWREQELAAMTADLGALKLLDDYHFAFSSERGGMNHAMDTMAEARGGGLLQVAKEVALAGDKPSLGVRLFAPLYPRGWFRQNQVLINRLFDERLARVDATRGVVTAGPTADEALRHAGGGGWIKRHYYLLANLFMPAFDHAEANYLAAHTHTQQAQTACALERFRIAHRTYPEQLAALVPDYLPTVPRDAMDGAPLRYRRTSDGRYELWSIGVNRVDDQAASDPSKPQRQQPDWVWRLPVAAAPPG